jgi:hypothetical protein
MKVPNTHGQLCPQLLLCMPDWYVASISGLLAQALVAKINEHVAMVERWPTGENGNVPTDIYPIATSFTQNFTWAAKVISCPVADCVTAQLL